MHALGVGTVVLPGVEGAFHHKVLPGHIQGPESLNLLVVGEADLLLLLGMVIVQDDQVDAQHDLRGFVYQEPP